MDHDSKFGHHYKKQLRLQTAFDNDLEMTFPNSSLFLSLSESSNQLLLPISVAQLVQMTLGWRPVVLML